MSRQDIGNKLSAAANKTAKFAKQAGSQVGKAVSTGLKTAGGAAASAASTASEAVGKGIDVIKESSPAAKRRKARINGFGDGINQGAYLVGQKRYNFYYAYTATLCFFLRLDGILSEEEQRWLENELKHLKLDGGLPEEVKTTIYDIAENEQLTFEDVSRYLDKVSLVSLDSIVESTEAAIELDNDISEKEKEVRHQLACYIESRAQDDCDCADNWTKSAIKTSLVEYGENYDRINEAFKQKTQLQEKDIAILMLATALQVARVLVINYLTKVEVAGSQNTAEKALHGLQEKLFNKIDSYEQIPIDKSNKLYASTHHILTCQGVPYDVTNTAGKMSGLFAGGHRVSTLGHDPVLGLIFGTSNIMTNTITCVRSLSFLGKGIGIPITYSVEYGGPGNKPTISTQLSTIEILLASSKRVSTDPLAAATSLLKQIIHIGTDLYTPYGIHLPFASILLDKSHAKKLTDYVSTGDILKVGVQAGMTLLINWIIAVLHGSSIIFQDDGEAFSLKTYQVRTKKIILLSNTIATSSSVIQSVITNNPKCLDLGGAAVLLYRLFTDGRFIAKVKEDYINSRLNDIYEKRAKGILL